MTRINAGIPVTTLCDQHLLAEAREIKRIPNCIISGRYNLIGQPKKFTLGTGHVKFFYDKQLYLFNRYQELYSECLKRGFKVTDFSNAWNGIPSNLLNDYIPSDADRLIIMDRINERLDGMKKITYTKHLEIKN